MPLARISLILSCHFSLSFIASGRSSGLHPVSSHNCWMYVRAGRPTFARPYVGVHRSTSLMSSSLLLQQCPACLVRLIMIVFVMGGRWPYSWCFVGCYIYKQEFALNYPTELICRKKQPTNQPTNLSSLNHLLSSGWYSFSWPLSQPDDELRPYLARFWNGVHRLQSIFFHGVFDETWIPSTCLWDIRVISWSRNYAPSHRCPDDIVLASRPLYNALIMPALCMNLDTCFNH